MNTVRGRAAVAIAAGFLTVGGAAAIPAALADDVAGPGRGPAAARPMMYGPMPGYGNRSGICGIDPTTLPAGTLSAAERATLLTLVERMKLGRDLHLFFADRYDAAVFGHAAMSRNQRLAALRTLLVRYDVSDRTADAPVGRFPTPAVQAEYDRLAAEGRTGRAAAMRVAAAVERADVDLLRRALDGEAAGHVRQVYQHLLVAAQHSLLMLETWSRR
jgi:hypothetical protein